MRIRQIFSRTAGLALCLVFVLSCFALPAFAYTRIDTEKTASMTVRYPCADTEFRLYRVAEASAFGEYTLTEDFATYGVSLDQPDQSGWRALAATLSGYAARDQLKPTQSGKTDAQGNVAFSGLPVGMYLVVGDKCELDDKYYISEPLLIALPSLDTEDCWTYEVTAAPKYATEPVLHPIDLKVIKVWKDGESTQRPKQIIVQLLRDGTVWDNVELNEKNSWRHTWEGLDDRYTWQVVEKAVPQGYTVTTQTDGNAVILTNTKPSEPNQPSKPNLPQTGVLWWPVGVLAAAGILLLLIGCIRRRNKHA